MKPNPFLGIRLLAPLILGIGLALGPSGVCAEPAATFIVREESTLSEISLRLYGTTHRWQDIAKWNGLSAPYRLSIGKRLKLEVAPTLSDEEGQRRVLAMWRKRFGLTGDAPAVPVARRSIPAIPATAASPAHPSETSTYSATEAEPAVAPEPAPKPEEIKERAEVKAQFEAALNAEPVEKDSLEATFESSFALGQQQSRENHPELAVASFRKARELNPNSIPAWLFEITLLKKLGRKDELHATITSFIDAHPQLKNLPMLKESP